MIARLRHLSMLYIAAAVCACGPEPNAISLVGSQPAQVFAAVPLARDVRSSGTWQTFPLKPGEAEGIVRAADGNFWVANYAAYGSLVRFTASGRKRSFSVGWGAEEIAADRKGELFFTNGRLLSAILKFDPQTRQTTEIVLNDDTNGGIALGADGNIWVVELSHIAKVAPDGRLLKEYATRGWTSGGTGLTWARGKVWYLGGAGISSLDPRNGNIASYEAHAYTGGGIVATDGSLFVAVGGFNGIYDLIRFDLKTETVTTYKSPRRFLANGFPDDVAAAPDGSVWYAAARLDRGNREEGGGFVRFDVRSKRFTTYASPNHLPANQDVTVAPDGKVWGTAGYAVTVLDPTPR